MLNDVRATLELLDSATTEARAATILTGLGFTEEMLNGRYSALSGGWRSRCSLATSLLVQSDVLLLDECTNFLDLEATIWCVFHPVPHTAVISTADPCFSQARALPPRRDPHARHCLARPSLPHRRRRRDHHPAQPSLHLFRRNARRLRGRGAEEGEEDDDAEGGVG